MSSTFGTLFRVSTYGESHGQGVGAIVDGCPPGVSLTRQAIQAQLDRRRPGQSELTTPRDESDQVTILSGVEEDRTLGTPIALHVGSRDARPGDYREMRSVPRPSHADFTYQAKYGVRSRSGGGRASARETAGRVAAGAIAEVFLRDAYGVEIVAWVQSIGDLEAAEPDTDRLTREQVDATPARCPDVRTALRMIERVTALRDAGDSIGAVIGCVCRGLPAGWGEPVFDKLEALLAHAMLSIPATKGFEIGSGFTGTRKRGSEHNDPFVWKQNRLGTASNHSGGIQGGISNGEPVLMRVAFKPPATIGLPQSTADFAGKETVLEAKGRHDPCVAPRAVPIVEAMAALVLADAALRQRMRG